MTLELQQFKADFFKALAHPLRIQILEALADGEKNVNEIQNIVGSEGSAVSQQLTILRNKNIVQGEKEGTRVIYSLKDEKIVELLSIAKEIFNNHLVNTKSILDQMNQG